MIESPTSSSPLKAITIRDIFTLKFEDKPEAELFECALIKINDSYSLFKVLNTNHDDMDSDDRQDLSEVMEFKQVKIPSVLHNLKAISLLNRVIVMLIDD